MFHYHLFFFLCPPYEKTGGRQEAVREHNIFGIWLDKDGVPNAQQPEPRRIG